MAFKKDIFNGSSFTQGYGVQTTDLGHKFDDRGTSAVRVCNDDTAAQTIAGLQTVIANAEANLDFEYPYKNRLYLDRIVATQGGGNIATAVAYYRPYHNTLYRGTPGTIEVLYHRDADGNDLVYGVDQPRKLTIPIYTLHFRHRYYRDSAPDFNGNNHRTINSASVTFGNLGTFAAKTCLFAPPAFDSYIVGETTVWEVVWTFVVRGDTWTETYWDAANSYAVADRDMYPTSTFPTIP